MGRVRRREHPARAIGSEDWRFHLFSHDTSAVRRAAALTVGPAGLLVVSLHLYLR